MNQQKGSKATLSDSFRSPKIKPFQEFSVNLPLFLDSSSAIAASRSDMSGTWFTCTVTPRKLAKYYTAFKTSVADLSFLTSSFYHPKRTAMLSYHENNVSSCNSIRKASKGSNMSTISSVVDSMDSHTLLAFSFC